MYTSDIKNRQLPAMLIIFVAAILAAACVRNDIPYPHIQPNIQAIEAENQSRAALIDSVERKVTLFLDEAANIGSVKLTKLTLSPGATCPDSALILEGLNLTDTLSLTLELYYPYVWKIAAQQNIERYFTIANQIGASTIDPETLTASAMVPTKMSLDAITVTSLKLGGTSSAMTPDLNGKTVDFTRPVQVTVSEFGHDKVWTLSVTQTDISVNIDRVDPWTNVAWVYATAEAGKTTGFQYRISGVDVWTDVPDSWIERKGGSFSARISGLSAETPYEVRAFSGEDYTVPEQFTTMSEVQLPNSTFQNWWLDGKIWCPWTQGESPFWGTGNKGATTLGNSNTVPVSDSSSPTGYGGARLESRFVGISILGKLAAGNLFAGDYVATEGTNGILAFGRPFDHYPTALKTRIDYTPAPISHYSTGFADLVGRPDTCIVWIALGDWDQPYEIRTNPTRRKLFNPEDPGVIAYGEATFGESTGGFIDVTVPLNYRSTARKPKYILVVASASKYGDYFTGGNGSVLTVNSFTLLFDY